MFSLDTSIWHCFTIPTLYTSMIVNNYTVTDDVVRVGQQLCKEGKFADQDTGGY